jgi:hypothetical protein
MRSAVVGVVVGLVLMALWAVAFPEGSGFPEASAQRPGLDKHSQDRAQSPELIALSFDGGDARQQVTLVDPRSKTVAVYHIDRATGAITLRSVRNVAWDLQIEEYNSASPTPREIRVLSETR